MREIRARDKPLAPRVLMGLSCRTVHALDRGVIRLIDLFDCFGTKQRKTYLF